MPSPAILAKRRQAARSHAKSTTTTTTAPACTSDPASAPLTVSERIFLHRQKQFAVDNAGQAQRAGEIEVKEVAAAAKLARSVAQAHATAANEESIAIKPEFVDSAPAADKIHTATTVEASAQIENKDKSIVGASGPGSDVEPDTNSDGTSEDGSSSARMRTSSSEDGGEDNLTSPPSSPDNNLEVHKHLPAVLLSVSEALERPAAWRSRRIVSDVAQKGADAAVEPKIIAPQPTIALSQTITQTTPAASASTERKIDWSLEEDDDDFFNEPLVFDDCTYTFQSNGIARTPTGASAPDALLVAVPEVTRAHTKTFLREVSYEKGGVTGGEKKVWASLGRVGAGSAAIASAEKVCARKARGKKVAPWRYTEGRDD